MFNQTGLVFARLFSVGMVQHSAAEPGDLDVNLSRQPGLQNPTSAVILGQRVGLARPTTGRFH